MVEGKADLSYSVAIELLPKIELADFKDIALEKLVAEVGEAEIDEGVAAHRRRESALCGAKGEGAKAENGDRVVVSFKGTDRRGSRSRAARPRTSRR